MASQISSSSSSRARVLCDFREYAIVATSRTPKTQVENFGDARIILVLRIVVLLVGMNLQCKMMTLLYIDLGEGLSTLKLNWKTRRRGMRKI
ncbi:uncharacterized protein G2W53_034173 [Senna tora]|uniref:Uncharacterized protein n=1 Tax=Senna tora TaxID=362788 RepID=A0A834T3M0_9FABA|nr:uncharacterized protein G2W53_034173 [Senna tora]